MPAASPAPATTALAPLQSVFTHSVPALLAALRCSLAVTTYQAGRLVLLRANGDELHSHFRAFGKPMGFAVEPGRIALGTTAEIWEFHDIPGIRGTLDKPTDPPHPPHDAAYLPRCVHFTGDIQVHEMAWATHPAGGPSELWFVNTRFSCLATRSDIFSFEPRWRPHFISALAPEDRCHLNGLALRDGIPRYATALGRTDTPGGWRDNKRSGGILMDIPSNQIISTGLSMPHSPRWHDGKLWVLDSGNGGLGIVDPDTGAYRELIRLPGFTRGFDSLGPYAFVGLSQVRESAVFSGIAIAELKPEDRACGVWIVDTRTATVVGFVKFTNAVQEIFAVQVLPEARWPDVIHNDPDLIARGFELSPAALELVPEDRRSS